MPQHQTDRYEDFMAKAAAVADSARTILNSGDGYPEDRQLRRASLALELAQVYGRLADIAARRETSRQRRSGGRMTAEDRGLGRGAYADQDPDDDQPAGGPFDGPRFH
jgi:hypothetical protein